MMKRFYILSAIVCSLFFASCEKEEMNFNQKDSEQTGNEDYIINPEDTAGIVVPDGYSLVVFPGSKAQTRAAITGTTDRISHLRYLIYSEEGGVYKYYKEKVVFSDGGNKTWPQSPIIEVLPTSTGQKYKVVFLGNVDAGLFGGEEVLSGTGIGTAYADARINQPSIGKFNEKNLFHWFSSNPFDPSTDDGKIVPVLLQRIVNRNVLRTYGIPVEVAAGDPSKDNYPTRFYASLMESNNPLNFREQVFGATGSLGKQFLEFLRMDIVFPIAYKLRNSPSGDKLTADLPVTKWYDAKIEEGTYWNNYIGTGRYTNATEMEEGREYLKTINASSVLFSTTSDKTCQFINDLYNGKIEYLTPMIASLEKNDIRYIDEGYTGNDGSFTLAKKEVIAALKTNQNIAGQLLGTWFTYGNNDMYITLNGPIPSSVDFDLAVKSSSASPTESSIKLSASSEREDRAIEVMLLGEKTTTNSYTFNYTSLTGPGHGEMCLPEQGFTSQPIVANTSTTYRMVPENLKLGDATTGNSVKIVARYDELIDACIINGNPPDGFQNDYTPNGYLQTLFKCALQFSYKLSGVSDVQWTWDNELGRLFYQSIQVHLDFKIPDFSSPNLSGNLTWQVE